MHDMCYIPCLPVLYGERKWTPKILAKFQTPCVINLSGKWRLTWDRFLQWKKQAKQRGYTVLIAMFFPTKQTFLQLSCTGRRSSAPGPQAQPLTKSCCYSSGEFSASSAGGTRPACGSRCQRNRWHRTGPEWRLNSRWRGFYSLGKEKREAGIRGWLQVSKTRRKTGPGGDAWTKGLLKKPLQGAFTPLPHGINPPTAPR